MCVALSFGIKESATHSLFGHLILRGIDGRCPVFVASGTYGIFFTYDGLANLSLAF